MLSRVAETIYWIGRYQERAENTARLIKVNNNLIMDLPKGLLPDWEPLITILGCGNLYHERHPELTERRIVNFLISDETNPGSIISCLANAREMARTIREVMPRESWEQINSMYNHAVDTKAMSYARSGRQAYLEKIMADLHQLVGQLAGAINHDTAYVFLNLGRKLERADMTTRIIDVRAENTIPEDAPELKPFEDMLWMSMLKSLTAYQMYRQSMQVRIRRNDVLYFLFCYTRFPRSVSYCVNNMKYYFSKLPNNEVCIQHIDKLENMLKDSIQQTQDNSALHEFIDKLQVGLAELHNNISRTYFPVIK